MSCRKIRSLLVDYNENSLTPEERKLVEDHLRVCVRCREELKEIQALFEVLEREKPEKVEENYWTNFVPEIRRRIESPAPPRLIGNLLPQLAPLMGFAVAILVIGIFLFSKDYSTSVPTYEQTQTYSLYEIENPVDQLADILSLAEDTEGIKDLITLGNGEDFKALNQMVDDQYWEKVQLEDLLKDLSSEELKLLENKIEDIKI